MRRRQGRQLPSSPTLLNPNHRNHHLLLQSESSMTMLMDTSLGEVAAASSAAASPSLAKLLLPTPASSRIGSSNRPSRKKRSTTDHHQLDLDHLEQLALEAIEMENRSRARMGDDEPGLQGGGGGDQENASQPLKHSKVTGNSSSSSSSNNRAFGSRLENLVSAPRLVQAGIGDKKDEQHQREGLGAKPKLKEKPIPLALLRGEKGSFQNKKEEEEEEESLRRNTLQPDVAKAVFDPPLSSRVGKKSRDVRESSLPDLVLDQQQETERRGKIEQGHVQVTTSMWKGGERSGARSKSNTRTTLEAGPAVRVGSSSLSSSKPSSSESREERRRRLGLEPLELPIQPSEQQDLASKAKEVAIHHVEGDDDDDDGRIRVQGRRLSRSNQADIVVKKVRLLPPISGGEDGTRQDEEGQEEAKFSVGSFPTSPRSSLVNKDAKVAAARRARRSASPSKLDVPSELRRDADLQGMEDVANRGREKKEEETQSHERMRPVSYDRRVGEGERGDSKVSEKVVTPCLKEESPNQSEVEPVAATETTQRGRRRSARLSSIKAVDPVAALSIKVEKGGQSFKQHGDELGSPSNDDQGRLTSSKAAVVKVEKRTNERRSTLTLTTGMSKSKGLEEEEWKKEKKKATAVAAVAPPPKGFRMTRSGELIKVAKVEPFRLGETLTRKRRGDDEQRRGQAEGRGTNKANPVPEFIRRRKLELERKEEERLREEMEKLREEEERRRRRRKRLLNKVEEEEEEDQGEGWEEERKKRSRRGEGEGGGVPSRSVGQGKTKVKGFVSEVDKRCKERKVWEERRRVKEEALEREKERLRLEREKLEEEEYKEARKKTIIIPNPVPAFYYRFRSGNGGVRGGNGDDGGAQVK
ncbi:hypothetical protein IE53DRAFT_389069 [Violaceomyces palustris]|uniref:Uncharacterized protein n=1 Tax=Violaceomyces palustris TaxID=1673888 RepID=A0ACD0NSA4_9BASI|nr:hypothetical protein IE53DRAFT_389069 [Violaceomyces palustris]